MHQISEADPLSATRAALTRRADPTAAIIACLGDAEVSLDAAFKIASRTGRRLRKLGKTMTALRDAVRAAEEDERAHPNRSAA